MIDRDVGSPLLEVVHLVAAVFHDGLDEHVRLSRSFLRIVHEPCLHALPLGDVALARSRRKRCDLERIATLGTCC
jgi:hypothetical protein